MPLARAALYEDGIDIHPRPHLGQQPTAWVATLQHIAREGRVFVIGTNQCVRVGDVPADVPVATSSTGTTTTTTCLARERRHRRTRRRPRRRTDPREAGMLVADIDLADVRGRQMFDAVGHYARPDLVRLDRRRCGLGAGSRSGTPLTSISTRCSVPVNAKRPR